MRPIRLDPETADRLLNGSVDPDDAPPGYAGVTELLAAARGAVSLHEPARETATVAAMEAVVLERLETPTIDPRRKHVRITSLAAKTAAASTVVLLGAGAAAATGSLPGTANPAATTHSNGHANSNATGDSGTTNGTTSDTGTTGKGNTSNAGASNRQGNGPNSHALPGLCNAMSHNSPHPNSNSVFSTINCSGITPVGGGNGTKSGTNQPAGPPSSTPVGPPSTPVGPPSSTPPSNVPPVSPPSNGGTGSSGSDNNSTGLSTASGNHGGASPTGSGAASAGGGNAGSRP